MATYWRFIFSYAITTLLLGHSAYAALDNIEIPFERFQLDNGLTVIVHEDHKAPVIAVSVWYHVGSKDEKLGKTGFAHLFEHLMFQGSENYKDDYFRPFELAGATDQNGTTQFDRTNYYETVPTTALDMALWMESDRMGHLLGAIGQKELDEQRGVVQNEKRERENQPYGKVWGTLLTASFPEGHPYRWEPIGSMEDLNAASLDDVKQWFQIYYGAANTTLVLAGDIDLKTAREKVTRYFGDIPSGPPVMHRKKWIAPRDDSKRDILYDRVAQTRIYRSWNIPPMGDVELTQLELAAAILGGGKTSRLYERLVYRDQLADAVGVSVTPFELASLFILQAHVKPGIDAKRIETAIEQEWAKFLAEGPTTEELKRVKLNMRAAFVRDSEKANDKATMLATGEVFLNNPAHYKDAAVHLDAATPATVHSAAKRWLTQGDYTLAISPFPNYTTAPSAVDRTQGIPRVENFPTLNFPSLERSTLKNGIEVILAQRHDTPVVHVQLLFDAGYAADQGRTLGASSFTMAMIEEGTPSLGPLDIAKRTEELGAQISTNTALDYSTIYLNTLTSQLKPALRLLADMVRNPAFRPSDMERVRGQWLAQIAQEKTQPTSLALRVLPPLVFGQDHAYAIPMTGSGTEESIHALTPSDLKAFHKDYIRPDNVRILVTGDTSLTNIVPTLNTIFGDWQAPTSAMPKKNINAVMMPVQPRVFLMDKPGAEQSMILAGEVAPPSYVPNYLEIQTMNAAFGENFTSRINMKLREEKHWAYGAGSFFNAAIGQRLFIIWAPVQTDKTAESIQALLTEINDVTSQRPLSHEEIEKIKLNDVRKLPGEYETATAVLNVLTNIVWYGRPDNAIQTLKSRIEAQSDEAIQAAAQEVIKPNAFTWVIVGDLAKIEAPVRALQLGPVHVLDSNGKIIR